MFVGPEQAGSASNFPMFSLSVSSCLPYTLEVLGPSPRGNAYFMAPPVAACVIHTLISPVISISFFCLLFSCTKIILQHNFSFRRRLEAEVFIKPIHFHYYWTVFPAVYLQLYFWWSLLMTVHSRLSPPGIYFRKKI